MSFSTFTYMHFCTSTIDTDESGNVPTVQMAASNMQMFDRTPIVQNFGFASRPPIGSIFARQSPDGDVSKGIAVGSLHQKSRPKNLKPGGSIHYDQAGNGVLSNNDGVVEVTASSSLGVSAPNIRTQGNITASSLATGVMSSPAGQMMIVRNGQVHTLTSADGSGAVTNPTALQNLLAEINSCGNCTFLQQIANEIANEEQILLNHLIAQITALNQWVELLTPPAPTPDAIVSYLKKVIKVIFGAQFNAQITAIQQLEAFIQEVAEIPPAVAAAVARIKQCIASVPAVLTPAVPTNPIAPPGTFGP